MSNTRQRQTIRRPAKTARRSGADYPRIGISGWNYAPWRGGTFYPEKWPHRRELEYASRHVNAIEINGTFYSLQRPESFRAWREATPEGFVFAVKGSRYLTHLKRLKDVETPLANFFASGVLLLREKLGPILWQFPPHFRYDRERLEAFFALLPRDTKAAAALARKHDGRVRATRGQLTTDRNRPMRYAMEVRHASFAVPEFIELLRKHDIGLVVADTAGKFPFLEDVTSDLVYVRLHGGEELYVSGYGEEALREWARKIRAWAKGKTPAGTQRISRVPPPKAARRDVFVFFDNDVKVRAPYDAMNLAHRLGLGPKPGAPPEVKKISETARTRWTNFRVSKEKKRARR